MQASAQIIMRNLNNVLDSISENNELFARVAIHPSTNYPGRTEENVLLQLIRKKLEPDIEEEVEQGRQIALLASPGGIEALQDVWRELRRWTLERIQTYVRDEYGDEYTKEEREQGIEHVRTGLKRSLEDEEDSEEEDDDEGDQEEDGNEAFEEEETATSAKAPGPGPEQSRGPEPETMLWFAARGDFDVPSNVEYGRKRGGYRGLQGVGVPPQSS